MARLGDICEILDSMRVPITASDRKPGPYPYYGANGVQDYVADYIFDDELVLLAEDGGNFGSKDKPIAYRVSGKCWVNNHAHVLKPKEGVDVDYLCYSLMFYDVTGLVNGATRKKLTQADMRKIEILLPPLDEQRKIAAVLDKISDLTAKRRRQLDKLDELVKSRFVEMFGDVLLDEKKWQKQRLSEIAEIVDPHPSHRTPPFSKNGIPYIGLTECDYNMYRINFKKARMVSKEILEEHIKRYTIDEGDFIIGKIGTIGKPFWIPKERSYVLSANTLLIKPKTSAVCPAYLFDVFQTTYMKHIIELGMKSTSQPAFGIQKAREIAIPLPPMELQKQYSHFVNYINGIMLNVQKGFDTLSMLRKLLMQKYFCADIEVIE